jgi:hypothetical protein
MKTNKFFFAVISFFAFAASASAQYVNNDDAAVAAFEKMDSVFMSKNDAQALYVDQTLDYAGNSARPVAKETRRNCGFYIGLTAGVNAMNDFVAPQGGITFGYLSRKWFLDGTAQLFQAHPFEASDNQEKFFGGSFDGTLGVLLFDGKEHHSQFFVTGTIEYNRTRDFQDFGTWSSSKTEETETQVITTKTDGKMDYMCNVSTLGYLGGFEYIYKFYNSPIHIGAYARAGVVGQLNGGDGLKYQFKVSGGIKVTYTIETGHRTNKKAADMVRFY